MFDATQFGQIHQSHQQQQAFPNPGRARIDPQQAASPLTTDDPGLKGLNTALFLSLSDKTRSVRRILPQREFVGIAANHVFVLKLKEAFPGRIDRKHPGLDAQTGNQHGGRGRLKNGF